VTVINRPLVGSIRKKKSGQRGTRLYELKSPKQSVIAQGVCHPRVRPAWGKNPMQARGGEKGGAVQRARLHAESELENRPLQCSRSGVPRRMIRCSGERRKSRPHKNKGLGPLLKKTETVFRGRAEK